MPCHRPAELVIATLVASGGTDLLVYKRLPSSCDGEPAPSREEPPELFMVPRGFGFPKGDRLLREGGSMGDVLAVEEPDRGWVADICGR